MGKDEELLLANLEKDSGSDSDEVVEEFKLPPPRVRRKRKPLPDARVHGGSSLITWKCCFSFIIISILLSGGLVLAFFIYNMYNQLNNLKQQVEFYKGNSNTIFSKHEQKINELESRHSSVLSFRATQNAVINKLDSLNKTVHKMKGTKSDDSGDFERQIGNIKTDIQTLQSSSAKAQATFSSTQQMLLKTVQQLKKDVQEMKVESLNPTSTNTNDRGGKIPSGDTSSGDYMTKQEVNELLKKFSNNLIDNQGASSKETVNQISNLNALYQSLNVSHNKDLLRLAKNLINLKESFMAFQSEFTARYRPIIIDLRNATRDVFHQLRFHNNSFDSLTKAVAQLREDFKALQESHKNAMVIPIPLIGKTGKTTVKPTNSSVVLSTATEVPQSSSKTPSVTTNPPSGTSNDMVTDKVVGPMLPDETKMHVLNKTSVNTTNSTSHVFTAIATKVYEQSAKNETEADYNKFQSAGTSAAVNMASTTSSTESVPDNNKREETGDRREETGDKREETGDKHEETGDKREENGDNKDYANLLSKSKTLNPYDGSRSNSDTDGGHDYQRGEFPSEGGTNYQPQGGSDYQPQGSYPGTGDRTYQPSPGGNPYKQGGRYEGGDTGESSATKKRMARVLKLLRSNRLSENQRREIMQRLLEKEGPRYDGD